MHGKMVLWLQGTAVLGNLTECWKYHRKSVKLPLRSCNLLCDKVPNGPSMTAFSNRTPGSFYGIEIFYNDIHNPCVSLTVVKPYS